MSSFILSLYVCLLSIMSETGDDAQIPTPLTNDTHTHTHTIRTIHYLTQKFQHKRVS